MNLITIKELVTISVLLALGLGVITYKVILYYKSWRARKQWITIERTAREAAYGNMIQTLIYDEKDYNGATYG